MDKETAIKILADMFANSMEHIDCPLEVEELLGGVEKSPLENGAEVWLKYWKLSAHDRTDPTFDWNEWVISNCKFIEHENAQR